MQAIRRYSLFRQTIESLVLCGVVLFVAGLYASQCYANQLPIHYALLGLLLAGSMALVVLLSRMRARLAASDCLEQQLSAVGMCEGGQAMPSRLNPILDQTGLAQGWNRVVQVLQDRTLDQVIERRLQESTSHRKTESFARAVRSLSDGVALSDSHGNIKYANPAWISLLGREIEGESQVIGSTISQSMESIGSADWQRHRTACGSGTKPLTVDLKRGANVHDGVVQLSRTPLDGRVNESDGFVWTLRDITQSMIAKESHEQFLSSATHELRTPLTNIRAYTESLLEIESISPVQQKEFFNIIYAEAGRMGRLLNQLLDIQQLEAGSMTLQKAAFDIQRMINEVQEYTQPLVAEKRLKLTCRISPNLKKIDADKEKLTSCLVNLVGNAVKYTPEGGQIRVTADQLESHIAISVEDTGIGIAKEELARVFERFYRCQDERVIEVEGNGLGLSFCQEVAGLHAGELTVESELNKGTRFTLRLPLSGNS